MGSLEAKPQERFVNKAREWRLGPQNPAPVCLE